VIKKGGAEKLDKKIHEKDGETIYNFKHLKPWKNNLENLIRFK
jgi:hypothetical protein